MFQTVTVTATLMTPGLVARHAAGGVDRDVGPTTATYGVFFVWGVYPGGRRRIRR